MIVSIGILVLGISKCLIDDHCELEDEESIPGDFFEAIQELDRTLPIAERERMRRRTVEELAAYQRDLGAWIRDNWLQKKDSTLQEYFAEKGVTSPEAMSRILLEGYWLHLQGEEVIPEALVMRWQKEVERSGYPAETECPDAPDRDLDRLFVIHETDMEVGTDEWRHYAICPSTGSEWVSERGKWVEASDDDSALIGEFLRNDRSVDR